MEEWKWLRHVNLPPDRCRGSDVFDDGVDDLPSLSIADALDHRVVIAPSLERSRGLPWSLDDHSHLPAHQLPAVLDRQSIGVLLQIDQVPDSLVL